MNLYERALGDDWQGLHPHVAESHAVPLTAAGVFDIVWGSTALQRGFARVLHLPREGSHVHVELELIEAGTEVVWRRRFGSQLIETSHEVHNGGVIERFGARWIEFSLCCHEGALVYKSLRAGTGAWSTMDLQFTARVEPREIGWHTHVEVASHRLGLICQYGGPMRTQ